MENTKDKIIHKALEMFANNGYNNTNLRDLAKEINLSKSAIYRHFESKEDLLNAVVKTIETHYKENINNNYEINDLKQLKELTINQIEFTTSDELITNVRKVIIQEQLLNPKMAKLADKHFIDIPQKIYTNIFNNLMNKKLIKKSDSSLLALEYISPITLYVHMIDRKSKSKKQVLNLINDYIDNFIETNKR